MASTAALAKANGIAQQRIIAAATALAERFNLQDHATRLRDIPAKDALVQAVRQREVIADLLEALVVATESKSDEATADTKRTRKKDS